MTEKHKPRWPRISIRNDDFIGQAGSLDLYVNAQAQTWNGGLLIEITCDVSRQSRATFTMGEYTEDGRVMFFDEDVVPELYELCLIHQLMGDYHDR